MIYTVIVCFFVILTGLLLLLTRHSTCPKCKKLTLVQEIKRVNNTPNTFQRITKCFDSECGYHQRTEVSTGISMGRP